MSEDGPVVLLRVDTEDPFTPESDDAALFLAEALRARGVRATFPVTTWKAEVLRERRRTDVLAALGHHCTGFHSTTHSLHPTIAETLEASADGDAPAAFAAREEAGMHRLAEILGERPWCYTQPGGNWAAEASPTVRAWGVPLYHSEGWNAYVDVGGRPFHLCNLLHFGAPVAAPKPFLSRLPGVLREARDLVRAAMNQPAPSPPMVHVVFHPTELVTQLFWDAVNFGGGVNRPADQWSAPPLRSAVEVRAASAGFLAWLDGLVATPGVRFWTARDLAEAYADPAQGRRFTLEEAREVAARFARGALGSTAVHGVPLSAAEGLDLMVQAHLAWQAGEERRALTLRPLEPPWDHPARTLWPPTHVNAPALGQAVGRLAAQLSEGRLPAELPTPQGALPLATVAVALAAVLAERAEGGGLPEHVTVSEHELVSARHVKPQTDLHWDWPVFAPGFRAPNLHRRAQAAAWTLKPAESDLVDLA